MCQKVFKMNWISLLLMPIIPLIFPIANSQSQQEPRSIMNQPLTIERVYDGCNVIKGCFGSPSNCIKNKNCELLVTFYQLQNSFQFQLLGKMDAPRGYIALGLSNDLRMGDDSVIGCYVANNGHVHIHEYVNLPRSRNNSAVQRDIGKEVIDSSSHGSIIDGKILCEFRLTNIVDLSKEINMVFDLSSDELFILLARGQTKNNDQLGYHFSNFNASQGPIFLTQYGDGDVPLSRQNFYKACASDRRCFGLTKECVQRQDCEMVAAFKEDVHGNFKFDLMGKHGWPNPSSGYIAVGFSSDGKMGEDSVIGCYLNGSRVRVDEFYNLKVVQSRKTNGKVDRFRNDNVIIDKSDGGSFEDGYILCHFSIKSLIDVRRYIDKVFNLAEDEVHILLARGEKASSVKLGFHNPSNRRPSPQPLLLSDQSSLAEAEMTRPSSSDTKLSELYKDCSVKKTCFGSPTGCVNTKNCEILTSFHQIEGGNFKVELLGQHQPGSTSGYVAVGLSRDSKMGEDLVFGCYMTTLGDVHIGEFYNTAEEYNNIGIKRTNGQTILEPSTSFENGLIYCNFVIKSQIDVTDKIFNLNSDKLHILLALGPGGSEQKLEYHSTKLASTEAINLQEVQSISSKKVAHILIELHGSLMIIAWILFASVGMFTARYFKQTFTNYTPKQKALWFWIHQSCMVTTVLLTMIAIILIFLDVKGYTWKTSSEQAETYHPILGIVLTCLSFLQILIALFRPDPQSSKRIFFNWIHWIIATLAHILACRSKNINLVTIITVSIACIYFAYDLRKSNLMQDTSYKYALAGFVILHLTLHFAMSVHTYTVDMMIGISHKLRALLPGPLRPSGNSNEYDGTRLRATILFLEVTGAVIITVILINCICSHL